MDTSSLSDDALSKRMEAFGKRWRTLSEDERQNYYCLKKEFDRRKKLEWAALQKKVAERNASAEYQALLKRHEEEAARRDHVRQRERDITCSTYERAQKRLRQPFDERLKRQLGIQPYRVKLNEKALW